jgi:hypothetical protein
MALLGPIDGALLLGFAHKHNTFVPRKSGAPLVGDVVLALSTGERDHWNLIILGKPLDGFDETTSDWLDHCRRGYRMSTVDTDELQNPFHRLQHRHIHVQIHSVDAFDFQNHMLPQDIGNALRGPRFRLLRRLASHAPL